MACARRSVRRAAPQFLQARVAPAAVAVELVADRVLLVEILVVRLGGIELARRDDRRDDLLPEGLGFFERRLGALRNPPLLLAVHEDRRAVLRADVAELPVAHG